MRDDMLEPIHYACLQDKTRTLLQKLAETAPFLQHYTLVGGSALALYLQHRKSEDLDFFTYADTFDSNQILEFCSRWDSLKVLNKSDEQLDLLIDGVKVTFFDARWSFLRPDTPQCLNVATLEAIAAMKVHVLFLRAKYRDYYDIFFLAHKVMGLTELYTCAKRVVPGLTMKLFCIALTYIDDIEDDSINHLDPVSQLSKQEIRAYFEEQIRGK
jgi:predicted nucleotidyltransferase component of viral defense system